MVCRFQWTGWTDQVLPAFEAARDQASLEPLKGLVPDRQLDPGRHILSGRRFLLFGPEERRLMQLGPLVHGAVSQLAEARMDTGGDLESIATRLTATRAFGEAGLALSIVLRGDGGLPKWMQSGSGPTVLKPQDTTQLAALLTAAVDDDALADHPALQTRLKALATFLTEADATGWLGD